jgi:hypothetical protein
MFIMTRRIVHLTFKFSLSKIILEIIEIINVNKFDIHGTRVVKDKKHMMMLTLPSSRNKLSL